MCSRTVAVPMVKKALCQYILAFKQPVAVLCYSISTCLMQISKCFPSWTLLAGMQRAKKSRKLTCSYTGRQVYLLKQTTQLEAATGLNTSQCSHVPYLHIVPAVKHHKLFMLHATPSDPFVSSHCFYTCTERCNTHVCCSIRSWS